MAVRDKVIITAALAGGGTTKFNNPAVPYTPEEFAEEAWKAYNSGAAIVHIHAKDPETGLATPEIPKIRDCVEAIRAKCPKIIINLSTAITVGLKPEQRIAPVMELKPEMASLNTNTMNFALADHKKGIIRGEFIFENTFKMLVDFAKKMKENGVKPELEIYDPGGIFNVLLVRKQGGIFEEPLHFQFVFGVAGGMAFTPLGLCHLVSLIPQDATWSVCGVGPNQVPSAMQSAIMGGHIRVGLEDNVRVPGGELAKGNWEQVEVAVQIARLAEREVASPDEAREILHLRGA